VSLRRPALSEVAPRRFAFAELDGTSVEVVLEGTSDTVEQVRVEKPAGEPEIGNTHELCASVGEALHWQIHVPGAGRVLSAAELRSGVASVRRRDTARWRRGGMLVAASVVFPAALLWHLGGRSEGLWLVVAAAGTAAYFSLRVWGALERRLRR